MARVGLAGQVHALMDVVYDQIRQETAWQPGSVQDLLAFVHVEEPQLESNRMALSGRILFKPPGHWVLYTGRLPMSFDGTTQPTLSMLSVDYCVSYLEMVNADLVSVIETVLRAWREMVRSVREVDQLYRLVP